MKKAFFQLLILTFAVSIAAQEKSLNEEIPKITFSNIKWSHKEDWKVTGAETYGTGDQMRPSTMTVQKRNYFLYQVSIKNETERAVKAFNYDLVFLRKTDGKEAGRLDFGYFVPLKKNKKISTQGYGGPPNRLVDAKDAETSDPTTSYAVNPELKCVMYDDNTIWRRPGLAENACNELIETVKKREEYLKRRGF